MASLKLVRSPISCVSFDSWFTRNCIRVLLALYVPTPSPHPKDSVETVKAQFLWSFNILLGGEGGGDMDL